MKNTDQPIVVVQTFDASIDKVWDAITDLEQMKQWFFENIPDFEPKVGFETRFAIEHEGRIFPHHWKITEMDLLKKSVTIGSITAMQVILLLLLNFLKKAIPHD